MHRRSLFAAFSPWFSALALPDSGQPKLWSGDCHICTGCDWMQKAGLLILGRCCPLSLWMNHCSCLWEDIQNSNLHRNTNNWQALEELAITTRSRGCSSMHTYLGVSPTGAERMFLIKPEQDCAVKAKLVRCRDETCLLMIIRGVGAQVPQLLEML